MNNNWEGKIFELLSDNIFSFNQYTNIQYKSSEKSRLYFTGLSIRH